MASLTLQEILEALRPAWRLANQTTEDGAFVRPDYRRALEDAWTDIVVYAGVKAGNAPPDPSIVLNVAMTRLGDHEDP